MLFKILVFATCIIFKAALNWHVITNNGPSRQPPPCCEYNIDFGTPDWISSILFTKQKMHFEALGWLPFCLCSKTDSLDLFKESERRERDFLIQAVHSPSRGRHRDNRGPDIRFGRSYLLIQEEKEIRDFIFDKFVV
jgi:hypothetical protein